RHLPQAARADLVVAGYALNEVPLDDVAGLARQLHAAATGLVGIVEPGTPKGFAVIERARGALIAAGGVVVAPCPHGGPCPLTTPDWCH
ncbi:small ribosomal subunit Rsm22 family protein, partial [Acinetobacter baumannii]